MPLIIAVETATEICSVALGDGNKIIAFREEQSPNAHSARLTVFIDECLAEAGVPRQALAAVAVSSGPGSYTGLRIGLSAAKGLCYALDIQLLTIPTLQAMAAGALEMAGAGSAREPFMVCPMIDARRMEVYAALYDAQGTEQRGPEADIVTAETYTPWLEKGPVYFSGNGMPKCRPLLESHPQARFLEHALPSARHLIPLAQQALAEGNLADLAYSEPFYLKEYQARLSSRKAL